MYNSIDLRTELISVDIEDTFDKVQYLIRTKALKNLGIEGTYANKIKTTSDKPIARITGKS